MGSNQNLGEEERITSKFLSTFDFIMCKILFTKQFVVAGLSQNRQQIKLTAGFYVHFVIPLGVHPFQSHYPQLQSQLSPSLLTGIVGSLVDWNQS